MYEHQLKEKKASISCYNKSHNILMWIYRCEPINISNLVENLSYCQNPKSCLIKHCKDHLVQ